MSYELGGQPMSDFLLPAWYVSFANPDGEWYQIFYRGGRFSVRDLGRFDKIKHGSLRAFTDEAARAFRKGN